MKTSDNGVALLALREGKRNKAYQDVKGIWTIGVGHTGPEVVEGLIWIDEQVDAVFRSDLDMPEQCLNTYVLTPLTQNQYDALVSFIFNVGVNAFKHSTMLKKLNLRDFVGVALEFDRWHIPVQIISRRNSEKAQFQEA